MCVSRSSAKYLGPLTAFRVNPWLPMALMVFLTLSDGLSAETTASAAPNYWPASSATSRLEFLLARAASVSNVAATLSMTYGQSQGLPPAKYGYYRSTQAGVTRIEVWGTRTSHTTIGSTVTSNKVTSEVVYAMLVDENTARVYVQSHGRLARFDVQSSSFWLTTADVLRGNTNQFGSGSQVYYVGSEKVDSSNVEVFVINGKPQEKLWVESSRGLVYKAQRGGIKYELSDVRVNTDTSAGLFSLDVQGKDIPEISEMKVGDWWPTTLVPQSTEMSKAGSAAVDIQKAAFQGDVKTVRRLLGNDPQIVKAKDEFGRTALHWAALAGHTNMVELLLVNGAEVDVRDDKNATPLWCAAANGNTDVVKDLISKGANINVKGAHGLTPVHSAVLKGSKDTLELLLNYGADVNAVDEAGRKPLDLAILQHRGDMVELLRQAGAKN